MGLVRFVDVQFRCIYPKKLKRASDGRNVALCDPRQEFVRSWIVDWLRDTDLDAVDRIEVRFRRKIVATKAEVTP